MNPYELRKKLVENVTKVMVGKEEIVDLILTSILCSGHILLEDIPGVGKTTLAKTVAKSLNLSFSRIQFTPDLLPSDVTGINFYNPKISEFVFKKGPVMANIVLADEINRATPKTQSSLLECMEERQVTVDGVTYPLEKLFLVIATQNPVEIQGTFPLPEAQLDRFLMKIKIGYPSFEEEIKIMERFEAQNPLDDLKSVLTSEDIFNAQKEIEKVYISRECKEYILNIITATRNHKDIVLGASPRASIALYKSAKAYAALKGRNYVIPDDIKYLSKFILPHRIILKSNLYLEGDPSNIVEEILSEVACPVDDFSNKEGMNS